MKRAAYVLLLTLALFFAFLVEASAVSLEDKVWSDFAEALPKEALGELFDGAVESEEDFAASVEEMSSAGAVMCRILEILGLELGGALTLFCTLCALLVASAAFSSAGGAFLGNTLGGAVRFCSSGAIFASVIYVQYGQFEDIELFFESLGELMRAMIPVGASLWAMGGNVSTASAGSAWFYVMINVCQTLMAGSVIPVSCIVAVLGICDSLSDEIKTGRIMSAIKKIYNFILTFIMSLLII